MPASATDNPLELFKSISESIGLPGLLTSGAVLTAVLLIFAYWRTRSPHVFLVRAWKLLHGPAASSSKPLADFIEERTELMRFRFFSGILCQSLQRAEAIISWSRDHNVDVSLIKKAGDYFQYEGAKPLGLRKVPSKWLAIGIFLVLMPSTYATLGAGALAIPHSVLLHTRKSDVWAFLSDTSISRLDRQGGTIPLNGCATDAASLGKPLGLASDEMEAFCQLQVKGELSNYVSHEVKAQRIALLLLGGIMAVLACGSWQLLMAILSARTIAKRIETKRQASPDT